MHLSAPLPLLPRSRPRPAQAHHQHPRGAQQARARRAGGPEDRALYHCQCGYRWTGEVTASPGCPHCGTPQAW